MTPRNRLPGPLRRAAAAIRAFALADSSPPRLAGSFALGVFVGSLPIPGFQNIATISLALLFRLNRVGAVAALELYSNALTLPFLCWMHLQAGRALLGAPPLTADRAFFRTLTWRKVGEMAPPLFLGAAVVGAAVAAAVFIVSFVVLRAARGRRGRAGGRPLRERIAALAGRLRSEVLVWRRIAADPRTPRAARLLLGAAAAYAISPIDLIPDFIPVLGYLDDLLVLPLLVFLAFRMIPPAVIAEHQAAATRRSATP